MKTRSEIWAMFFATYVAMRLEDTTYADYAEYADAMMVEYDKRFPTETGNSHRLLICSEHGCTNYAELNQFFCNGCRQKYQRIQNSSTEPH